jgi:hypothetical protein
LINRFESEILLELIYSYNTIANLIKLYEYRSYDDFESEKKFRGDICVYEYYYLKGLMYNNYKLKLCSSKEDFQNNYQKIININKNDPLLQHIFNKRRYSIPILNIHFMINLILKNVLDL